jgi:hypothetical protein
MSTAQWGILVAAMGAIFIPLLVAMLRITVKWTRIEAALETMSQQIASLVQDKDKAHAELASIMKYDRDATDRRLRWLEEHLWKGGNPDAVRRTGR